MSSVIVGNVSNVFGDDNSDYGVDGASEAPLTPCMPPVDDLPPTGDIGAEFAALVITNSDQNKAAARQLQKSEEAMQTVDDKREIKAMQVAATQQMIGAVTQVVANVCDAVGAAFSAGGAAGAGKGMADLSGIGAGVAGIANAEAKFADADAKNFDMQAESAKRGAQASKDVADDAKKLADKAIDFYQQWVQGQTSAMQAALHRT